MVQLQETVLGKAAYKSASLMKDMDELTMKARILLAEIALPCFVCTHDHSNYLAMEQHYYNKGRRTVIDESEENLMQVIKEKKKCQKQVVQERTQVESAEIEMTRAKTLLTVDEFLFWCKAVGSKEELDAAMSVLERCEKGFQKAQSSLKDIEQKKIQAELVQACLMSTLSKHLAMDWYFYSKEGKIKTNHGSESNLVTIRSSALQQSQEQVDQARTDVRSAENKLKDKTKAMVKLAVFGSVIGGIVGTPRLNIKGRKFSLVLEMGCIFAAIIVYDYRQDVGRQRSELGRCNKLYQTAQHSLEIQQKVDTETDNDTCSFLKDHGWYYCNEEGTRQQNAAKVNQAIITKRSALKQYRQQVEQARIHVRNAENKLRQMMFVQVGVGAEIGCVFGLIGGPINAALMANRVATVATGTTVATVATVALGIKYLVDKSALERCKKDYQRVQGSLREMEHDLDTVQVQVDKFTHLKRPMLVPVEWRYFYRHRHIVLKDVKLSKAEIEVKMNTKLQYYFSKFRNFFGEYIRKN